MNQEQLQQKIAEYFAKLPSEAQTAFSSMIWMSELNNIITKYSLNSEQTEILGTETTLVLLGMIGLTEYQENLEKELKLEAEILEKIMLEIDEKVLGSTKTQLSETFENNLKSLEKEIPTPPYAKTEIKVETPKVTEAPKNIMEEKLKGATASTNTISDYTTPKISAITSPSNDPYHEPIE